MSLRLLSHTVKRTQHTPVPVSIHRRLLSDEPARRKNKANKVKKQPVANETENARNLKFLISCLEAPVSKEPPISEEEKARRMKIGKAYVAGMFRLNNEIDHDLTCKIKLKTHAMKMLPRNTRLKDDARTVSDVMPPIEYHIPTTTPPIPGFKSSDIKRRAD